MPDDLTPPTRPTAEVSFPPGVVDHAGRRLRPGAVVTPLHGPYVGEVAEVVGWSGSRGVEIYVHGDPPDQVAVLPKDLSRFDVGLPDPLLAGWQVLEETTARALVIHPVGARDVQVDPTDPGPFPAPQTYTSARPGGDRRADARRWAEACLAALAEVPSRERDAVVLHHLRAPMLARMLTEASLPQRVARLALVGSAQDPPHVDDTAPMVELLRHWLHAAMTSGALRPVDEVAEPVLLRAPALVEPVVHELRSRVPELAEGCDHIVVTVAGGTPAMMYGAAFAALEAGEGRPVRAVQVPYGEPVVELDIPPLVKRKPVAKLAAAMLRSGLLVLAPGAIALLGRRGEIDSARILALAAEAGARGEIDEMARLALRAGARQASDATDLTRDEPLVARARLEAGAGVRAAEQGDVLRAARAVGVVAAAMPALWRAAHPAPDAELASQARALGASPTDTRRNLACALFTAAAEADEAPSALRRVAQRWRAVERSRLREAIDESVSTHDVVAVAAALRRAHATDPARWLGSTLKALGIGPPSFLVAELAADAAKALERDSRRR